MREAEPNVAAHYTTGQLTERAKAALREMLIDPETATPGDLKAMDEFHTGGILATEHFFGHLDVPDGTKALDIGSGVGGTSRYMADRFGIEVTGVDLTPEFVETATALSEMVGLSDKTTFKVGSALEMPVEDNAFDLAILMHVGMNIADKDALFAEAARALAPGGTFAIFEVMKGTSPDALDFPLPWSTVAETSFVADPQVYKDAAAAAGFELILEEDRSTFAMEFMAEALGKAADEGPSPLGIHIMMGETAGVKLKNYLANLIAAKIRPTEMIFKLAS